MSDVLDVHEVERFRGVLSVRLGLDLDGDDLVPLAELLARRVEARRESSEVYLRRLETAGTDELAALAPALTIGETYFFRNRDQFRAFSEVAIPDRIEAARAHVPLRVLSAGCSSGEEAYSIAMVLRRLVTPPQRWSVRAVDLNADALARGRRGRFSPWSLRETLAEDRERWFMPHGRELELDAEIREAVAFECRNLLDDDPELWPADAYDVVFCRNVLMYLTPEAMRSLVERIARSLVPGGYLFVGHAETLRGLSNDFHLCHTHGTFYYQRKDGPTGRHVAAATDDTAATRATADPLVTLVDESTNWVEAIAHATERVAALTAAAESTSAGDSSAPDTLRPVRYDLARPLELLREERFGAALGHVASLPAGAEDDPDVLLLEAALLTHSGDHGHAEQRCLRLLELDELNAGAQYLLALCRESAGDLDAAVEHDRIAAHLDPSFSMARVHLGLLARKLGETTEAAAAFETAIGLLEREEPARLLLFGGGFGRDALVALCRAELARAELGRRVGG